MLFGAGKRTKNGNMLGVVIPVPIVGILVVAGVICVVAFSIITLLADTLLLGVIQVLSSRTMIVLGCCFAASYIGWTTTTGTWTRERIKRVLVIAVVLGLCYTVKYWVPVVYDIFMWGPRNWHI